MAELHLPWLELAVLIPIFAAIWTSFLGATDRCRTHSVVFSGLTLVAALGAWLDFATLKSFEASDRWDLAAGFFHRSIFVVDELSAPLLPLMALFYLLTLLVTVRTKVKRFSFPLTFVSQAILMMTLSCKISSAILLLLTLGIVPMYLELRARGKPTRVFLVHMGVMVLMMIVGQCFVKLSPMHSTGATLGIILLALAMLMRDGIVPVHCWLTDLFEHASFGSALLFATPMIGVYGAMRIVFPIAPPWVLEWIAIISLITAFYAAGMALVQRESRRFFTYLFLSNSSLVLVGIEIATPIGLTGALCVWISVVISLGGFGLTLRAIEARTGRLSLDEYHGLYHKVPLLAGFFLLTGMASIGFPGTIGFVGTELLVDGARQISWWIEAVIILTMALNSLAVLHAYFHVFTGRRHAATVDLRCRKTERYAVMAMSVLILGGGLYPQPGLVSRHHAAEALLAHRAEIFPEERRREEQGSGAVIEETPKQASVTPHVPVENTSITTSEAVGRF